MKASSFLELKRVSRYPTIRGKRYGKDVTDFKEWSAFRGQPKAEIKLISISNQEELIAYLFERAKPYTTNWPRFSLPLQIYWPIESIIEKRQALLYAIDGPFCFYCQYPLELSNKFN